MTRIEITQNQMDKQTQKLDASDAGLEETETAGLEETAVAGLDRNVTEAQNADASVEEQVSERDEEPEMFRRQTPTEDQERQSTPEDGAATLEDANGADDSSANGAQASDDNDRFLRAVADLENFKRQSTRRESESRDRAVRNVIEDLLPVMDNFERALDAARNARDVESVRVGVEFIAQQLRDALKNHGVEPIESKGQKFDPLHHEALEEIESDQPEGTVVEEAQRGYSFKGQVLRPSLVRVAGK